ncbi:MAG: hypothetical protein ACREDD_13090 [Methylocella sp.]
MAKETKCLKSGRPEEIAMFRPAAEILKPDPRYENIVHHNQATGQLRAATVADWHALIAEKELTPQVPERIRNEFDKARNAFLYSWFSYELASLAEQQSYATLEMAIRIRLKERDPGSSPLRGLKKLLHAAQKSGLLNGIDHTLIDLLSMQRNEIAHGSSYLFPQASLDMIKYCAELLNALYAAPGANRSDP